MSYCANKNGRRYVECDETHRAQDGSLTRCGRRSRLLPAESTGSALNDLFDLARGWSVAPYPDDYDHGATRTSLLDGSPIPPTPTLVGIRGDLHTCPVCRRR